MPNSRFNPQRLTPVLFAVALLLALAVPVLAATHPDFDAVTDRAAGPVARSNTRSLNDPELSRLGKVSQMDERFNVPTFVWGARPNGPAAVRTARLMPEQAARTKLAALAPLYNLEASDVDGAAIRYIHDTGRGGVIVAFRQVVGGVDVFRDELKLMMDRDNNLIAASGYIASKGELGKSGVASFRLQESQAIAAALADYADGAVNAGAIQPAGQGDGGYLKFDASTAAPQLAAELAPSRPIRIKRVLFHEPGSLKAAYYIEVMSSSEAYSYVVSADDASILFRHSLTESDSYTYRVWADNTSLHTPYDGPQGNDPTPHPTGTPNNLNPALILPVLETFQNGPISTNDPWLPPASTETVGNNVDAYADLVTPDGLTAGDFRATTTSPSTFDRTYDTNQSPAFSTDQQRASVTQLFYDNNYYHDWYYDAGFNEASGNAQADNLGRGGVAGDALHAEAQDFGGTNNANMSTPADGGSPRMQMYVFTASATTMTVNSPAVIAGSYAVGSSTTFGPQSFDVTGNVVLVDDGVAPTGDGCSTPFVNVAAVAGKIALIDRGTCSFVIKVKNAQLNGAIGVIIANNTLGVINMGGTDATIIIPTLSISQSDGNILKAQLGVGVNVRLLRAPALNRDGTLDNQIVAHEWGHYISNRLIGNSSGLTNTQGRGMGEGWGDFSAMLMTVRESDALAPANANYNGVYALASYAVSNNLLPDNAYYFGIRRLPYSTDFGKNALTFKHITNGVALPVGPATSFGQNGANNAEVHNAGEVWCSMLWECYAALLRDTGRLTFDQARNRMRDYLVASYKMTPNAPTFTEGRDAVLAAAYAGDPADFNLFCAAFARRGIGSGAVSPDRASTTNAGAIESYVCGGDLAFVSGSITDDVVSCDHDTYLDNLETGTVTVTLHNVGATTLTATTATLSSTNPNVSFPSGNNMVFPSSAPYSTVSASLPIHLAGAVGLQVVDVQISYNDPGLLVAGPRSASFSVYGNAETVPSTLETVEATSPNWAISGGTPATADRIWRRNTLMATSHDFFAPDAGSISDQYLVSPPIQVSPAGSFTFSFSHAYQFESPNFDGGVIEISTDGGANWADIGAFATPGYTGTIATGGGNPIEGRLAFIGTSGSYPNLSPVSVNLSTLYAGQTVLLRFRATADVSAGAHGWEIDNVQVNNTLNSPFIILQGQAVTGHTIVASAGTGGSISPSGNVTVGCGANQAFTIAPTGCYAIADVLVDGVSAGAVASYTFTNVQVDHTIAASFSLIGAVLTPITGLTAAQVRTGNDADGTTKIQISFTPSLGNATEVWRKGFGSYPIYDNGSGAVPATPGSYPPSGWTLTGVTASGQFDETGSRDFWYYVAYAKDACGNAAPVSNRTGGTLGYHLGDVSDGITAGTGDNSVSTLDMSLLGAHYGVSGAGLAGFEYLDVGPTTDHTYNGRPTTDGAVNFEDLVMFALNYTPVVSLVTQASPSITAARSEQAAASNALWLEAPEAVKAGDIVRLPVRMSGAGNLQALSVSLRWDATVVEPTEINAGDLITSQGGVVFSPEAGRFDAALLGAGRQGIVGEGAVATALFRVVRDGNPQFAIIKSVGRDGMNRDVALVAGKSGRSLVAVTSTELFPVVPNPARGKSLLQYSVVKDGLVDLSIYSVDGRRVKTVMHGEQGAGSYRATWNGVDDRGASLKSGVYFVRLQAAGVVKTRLITLVQ